MHPFIPNFCHLATNSLLIGCKWVDYWVCLLFSLRRVATIESIGSSTRIEGSKLSDRNVEKLLGRLSRVLTTLLLLRAGYAYVPYSSLEAIIEQNKQAYCVALRQTQGTIRTDSPKWESWVVFFLRSLASQVIRLEEKVIHEKLVLAAIPALSLVIIDLAKKQGRFTINDVVLASQANRNTIKTHLRKLTQSGQIKQHGAGRGVWYGLS